MISHSSSLTRSMFLWLGGEKWGVYASGRIVAHVDLVWFWPLVAKGVLPTLTWTQSPESFLSILTTLRPVPCAQEVTGVPFQMVDGYKGAKNLNPQSKSVGSDVRNPQITL